MTSERLDHPGLRALALATWLLLGATAFMVYAVHRFEQYTWMNPLWPLWGFLAAHGAYWCDLLWRHARPRPRTLVTLGVLVLAAAGVTARVAGGQVALTVALALATAIAYVLATGHLAVKLLRPQRGAPRAWVWVRIVCGPAGVVTAVYGGLVLLIGSRPRAVPTWQLAGTTLLAAGALLLVAHATLAVQLRLAARAVTRKLRDAAPPRPPEAPPPPRHLTRRARWMLSFFCATVGGILAFGIAFACDARQGFAYASICAGTFAGLGSARLVERIWSHAGRRWQSFGTMLLLALGALALFQGFRLHWMLATGVVAFGGAPQLYPIGWRNDLVISSAVLYTAGLTLFVLGLHRRHRLLVRVWCGPPACTAVQAGGPHHTVHSMVE